MHTIFYNFKTALYSSAVVMKLVESCFTLGAVCLKTT